MIELTCKQCGEKFFARSAYDVRKGRKYCSKKCSGQARKINDGLTQGKRWRLQNPEKYRKSYMKSYIKARPRTLKWKENRRKLIREKWGKIGVKGNYRKATEYIEEFVIEKALPKEGYTNIVWLTKLNTFFPFDIKADKNGVPTLFEVTGNIHHPPGCRYKLAEALGFKAYYVFVKPNLSKYFIIPIKDTKDTWLPDKLILEEEENG